MGGHSEKCRLCAQKRKHVERGAAVCWGDSHLCFSARCFAAILVVGYAPVDRVRPTILVGIANDYCATREHQLRAQGRKESPPSSAILRRKAAGVRPKYILN